MYDSQAIQFQGREDSYTEESTGAQGELEEGKGITMRQARSGRTVYIYALIDPRNNTPRYVGKTVEPRLRLKQHLGVVEQTPKYCWIKMLKEKGLKPTLEILEAFENSDDTDWQEAEVFWIKYLRFLGFDLANLESGGTGGKFMAEETKAKLSESSKKRDPSTRLRGDNHPAKKDGSYFRRGDNHPTSQLTDEQVIDARAKLASRQESLKDTAKRLGVAKHIVWQATSPNGKTFRHLPMPVFLPKPPKQVPPPKAPREPKPPKPKAEKQLGSKHHNATLTESQVIEMRELAAGGMSYADVGRRFGVSEKLAWSNCHPGSTKWKHLPNPNSDTKKRHLSGEKHPKAVLTEEQVIEGHRLHSIGLSYRKIAEVLGVKHTTLFGALSDKGKAWKNLQPKAA